MTNYWRDKRILITGSCGVIGRVLVKLLIENGANILSIDKSPIELSLFRVEHIQVDLSERTPRRISDFAPTVVFHLAAAFERTDELVGYWKTSFNNNASLSHRLLRSLENTDTVETFVFASSYLIYDSEQYLNRKDHCILKEAAPVKPRNLVGVSKYLTERELDFIDEVENRFRSVSARIFRVYGCSSRDIISRWIKDAIAGHELKVFGQDSHFDYIFADDVAVGLVKLAECTEAKGVVNLGSGKPRSVRDVVHILRSNFQNLKVHEMHVDYEHESNNADMTLFKKMTDWVPGTSLEEGMKRVISYELETEGGSK